MSDSLAAILAHNTRTLRQLRGMSQVELAERIGASRRTIARIEAGESADPGVAQVKQLAAALGVPVAHLIEGKLALVTLPLPAKLAERLAHDEAPALLARMIGSVDGDR